MAAKSEMPRASTSLRSITRMLRITGGRGVDAAPMRAWTCVILLPPRVAMGQGDGDAGCSQASRPDHAVPRPEPILTQKTGNLFNFSAHVRRETRRMDGIGRVHRRVVLARLCRLDLRPNSRRYSLSCTHGGYIMPSRPLIRHGRSANDPVVPV